jgi:large subunit ribosomal protein L5
MRLKEKYRKTIVPALAKQLGFKNEWLAPRLVKAVINVSFGKHLKEKDFLAGVAKGLAKISGQKPVFTKAKKSISAFKIREGLVIGAKVTLRGRQMYDFVEKLVGITFPRVRDFRGISDKAVDRQGNLTIGLKDCTSFPEIRVEDLENIYGLEICLATTAKDRQAGLELFRQLGFPFKPESK